MLRLVALSGVLGVLVTGCTAGQAPQAQRQVQPSAPQAAPSPAPVYLADGEDLTGTTQV